MDGFVSLIRDILVDDGVPDVSVFGRRRVDLPGYYRAEKKWDLLIVSKDQLLATIEFKSQVGPSFGNNFNNRSEEAIGSAADFRTAYRDGAFKLSQDPWLGYLMLLEDAEQSRRPVAVTESHFQVFPEFRDASYAKQYELLLTRLIRERLYDAACFLTSSKADSGSGKYREPSVELSFERFITSLRAKVLAFLNTIG